jgi:hypothetical protein
MTITAKVIAHSVNENGNELLTVECRYQRLIHCELLTHRMLSRNSASSRAIPTKKILADIKNDMAMPTFWGKNQSGMQASEELTGLRLWLAKTIWIVSGHIACWFAWVFSKIGLHKQIANRIVEPWSHITVLISATEWENFFGLRMHKDAQPEIQKLAIAIYEARANSKPKLLPHDGWHLPYITEEEFLSNKIEDLINISAARCASISYKTVDGKDMTLDKAKVLGDKLFGASPIHASPAEHIAQPDSMYNHVWVNKPLHGNFVGFIQYRKTLPNENMD